jgi:hypothetical protein
VGIKPFAAGEIIGLIVPYYGSTRTPAELLPEAQVTGEKVKTD